MTPQQQAGNVCRCERRQKLKFDFIPRRKLANEEKRRETTTTTRKSGTGERV
jgi:hypothetical protein